MPVFERFDGPCSDGPCRLPAGTSQNKASPADRHPVSITTWCGSFAGAGERGRRTPVRGRDQEASSAVNLPLPNGHPGVATRSAGGSRQELDPGEARPWHRVPGAPIQPPKPRPPGCLSNVGHPTPSPPSHGAPDDGGVPGGPGDGADGSDRRSDLGSGAIAAKRLGHREGGTSLVARGAVSPHVRGSAAKKTQGNKTKKKNKTGQSQGPRLRTSREGCVGIRGVPVSTAGGPGSVPTVRAPGLIPAGRTAVPLAGTFRAGFTNSTRMLFFVATLTRLADLAVKSAGRQPGAPGGIAGECRMKSEGTRPARRLLGAATATGRPNQAAWTEFVPPVRQPASHGFVGWPTVGATGNAFLRPRRLSCRPGRFALK